MKLSEMRNSICVKEATEPPALADSVAASPVEQQGQRELHACARVPPTINTRGRMEVTPHHPLPTPFPPTGDLWPDLSALDFGGFLSLPCWQISGQIDAPRFLVSGVRSNKRSALPPSAPCPPTGVTAPATPVLVGEAVYSISLRYTHVVRYKNVKRNGLNRRN
ncbi:hypothetical protein J6590_057626 [Homalodisca vitripennis]|nr:hypothetical protein J6590_057626 [Homalodisca vitripennis]